MSILLSVIRGPQSGREFVISGHDTFLVGRSSRAHFRLADDPYFSRNHFLIEANPPLCRLTDLSSRNGTKVNGQPTKTIDLKPGDEIEGGTTVLLVTMADEQDRCGTLDLPGKPSLTGSFHAPVPGHREGTQTDVQRRMANTPAQATIPGYSQLEEIGRGGMGVVYRARRDSDGCTLAIKAILPAIAPEANSVRRFLREIEVLRSLVHPHIVTCHDSGEYGGMIYYVMDFIEGIDASRMVRDQGPLPVKDAVAIALQMAEGLAFAHDRGFVHRDVKPANLLLTTREGATVVTVADFGLARAYQDSPMSGLTISGDIAGTPAYMAPEQITDFRAVQPAADQYSAAGTLFFLLTGQLPFQGNSTADILCKVLEGRPNRIEDFRPDIPTPLAAAIRRGMSLAPGDRFKDLRAMAAELRRV